MNKKFITLCVSALLAGGMVTPAFADTKLIQDEYAVTSLILQNGELSSHFYFEIKGNNDASSTSDVDYDDWSLKATLNGYYLEQSEPSASTLWKLERHTNGNGLFDGYYITNAYGIPLAISGNKKDGYKLDREGSIKLFQFYGNTNQQLVAKTDDGNIMLYREGGQLKVGLEGAEVNNNLVVAVFLPGTNAIPVKDNVADNLNSVFGDHFSLQIGYYDKEEYKQYENLQGNVFTGKLYTADNGDLEFSDLNLNYELDQDNGETFLMNEAGEFLVLLKDKWNIQNTDLDPETSDLKGYRFATMTAKELGEDLASEKPTVQSYVFRVAGVNGHIKDVDSPLEVAVKVAMTDDMYDAETWAELLVAGVNNESGDKSYYLTTAPAANEKTYNPISDKAEDLDLNIADYTGTTYVRFGENNYVSPTTFWGAAWNITRNDNKTPNPESKVWVDKREVGYTVPEGQWILREVNKVQTWVNRETGENLAADDMLPFAGLRTTNVANVYTDGTYNYEITKAVDLADADRFDYFGYDAKETSTGVEETYKVVFDSQLTGEPVYISMDGVGELHLTNDPTKAIEFHVDTIKTTDDAAVVNDLGRNANADVFDIFNTYMGKDKDGNWVEKEDTVSYYRYTLSHDGKYLHYSADDNKFVLNEPVYNDGKEGSAGSVDKQGKSHLVYTKDDLKTYAFKNVLNVTDAFVEPYIIDAFVIKEKGGDLLNIINVDNADYEDYFDVENDYSFAVLNDKNEVVGIDGSDFLGKGEMMYFDFNFDEARQQQNIYNWVSNAQLQLDYQDYDIYRNVAPTAPDTMAIYRTEYQDEFLFEKNGFLGMTVDDRGYNAALFIDTAYVRNNTEKPLFMIGLRPEITPETVYCPIHGVDAGCAHEHLDTIPGYVDADYLTVLADSSAFHAAELDNKFLANKAYTKLSFVAARHNVDTITVAADGHKTTISQNVQHPMVFAFRIVDQATQDFIIEGVDLTNNKAPLSAGNPYKTSWMRWNNGVPVMTDIMEDAEVFNIAGDLENANPTANEAIEAEATVSVVATDGAVIVKGAEGKNVIVSTILGKVVANEVVNSDNETIAAPAGIVVVSVDGESFKVAVK